MMKWFLAGLLFSMVGLADASFMASVNKTHVGSGESITLTLTFLGQTREEPDLSELEREFSVVSRQISQESTMIQGSFQAKTRYILEIFPKSADKTIIIPSIKLATHRTDPITITHSDSPQKQADGVSLTLSTDRTRVYVHGELMVRITLRSPSPLRSGTLSELDIKDAIIEPLESKEREEVIDKGIRYFVITKAFAVYPTKPGTLVIPAIIFHGVINQETRRRGWPDFFNPGQRITARSTPLNIEVMDVPKDYPKGHPFLPLKNLVITETVEPAKDQLSINEVYTRRFEIKAKGTLSSDLPSITKPDVANVSIYVEEGEHQQKNPEDGIEASRIISHIYMPQSPGKIDVPEENIYWWDVDNDKLEVTPVRRLELDIIGNPAPKGQPQNPSPQPQVTPPGEHPDKQPEEGLSVWIFVLGASVLVSLATLAIWLKMRSARRVLQQQGPHEFDVLRHSIQKACDEHDVHGVLVGLLALKTWSMRHHTAKDFDEELASLLFRVESLVFETKSRQVPEELFESIGKLVSRKMAKKSHKTVLAPLYPV